MSIESASREVNLLIYNPVFPADTLNPAQPMRTCLLACCWLTTVTSSPWMPTSGRLKWHRAVMAAMLAASIRFPSWFSMWTSTLICHTFAHTQTHTLTIKTMFYNLFLLLLFVSLCVFTFSPDTTHRDSVSMHLEFLKHLSSCLLSFTDNSDCLERQRRELTGDLQSLHTVWVGADTVTFECVAQFGRGNQGVRKRRIDQMHLFHTCPVQKLARPGATAQCWRTWFPRWVDSPSGQPVHTTPGPSPFSEQHISYHHWRSRVQFTLQSMVCSI